MLVYGHTKVMKSVVERIKNVMFNEQEKWNSGTTRFFHNSGYAILPNKNMRESFSINM